jgi:hypothetical protein
MKFVRIFQIEIPGNPIYLIYYLIYLLFIYYIYISLSIYFLSNFFSSEKGPLILFLYSLIPSGSKESIIIQKWE